MKLLSVNVGRPANPWNGLSATGIDKQPVNGPVPVTAPGPKGTGEVGLVGDRAYDVKHHGGADQAVYAYAREDLDGWIKRFTQAARPGAYLLVIEPGDIRAADPFEIVYRPTTT